MSQILKLGIMGSTRGSNLIPLTKRLNSRQVSCRIEAVVCNKQGAAILEKAQQNQWPAYYVSTENRSREAFEQEVSALLKSKAVDLIILLGFMRILSSSFIQDWSGKILNVHPSLLPNYAGLMNEAVHQAVLNDHQAKTGCTVHEVSEFVDEGPIITQKECMVLPHDTVTSLKRRVQALEVEALAEAIQTFHQERVYV